MSHSVGVLQVGAIKRVGDAHVGLLQRHHFGLDLQEIVAHEQPVVVEFALAAVGWVDDVRLHPLHGCWSEQSRYGVRNRVLLC